MAGIAKPLTGRGDTLHQGAPSLPGADKPAQSKLKRPAPDLLRAETAYYLKDAKVLADMVKAKQNLTVRMHSNLLAKERGGPVQIVTQQVTRGDGSMASVLAIDLSQALAPDRVYCADLCGVVYENSTAKLLFGQQGRDGTIRSMVEVTVPPLSAMQFLELFDGLKNPSIPEILQILGLEPAPVTKFTIEPKDIVQFKANLVTSAFYGSDSCLDFYNISAFTMGVLQKNGGSTTSANVLGVVRIETSAPVVASLVNGLRELKSQFPSNMVNLVGNYGGGMSHG